MLATFTGYDWLIVIVYIILGTLPGFLLRKYIRGQAEFLVAGRTLSVFLATATLTATEMGLVTVMYFAQSGFLNGFSAFTIGIIALCTTLFVGLTGFLVAGFRASGVTTFAEFYEKRYSRRVRLLGGLILASAGILNYGVFLRVEAEFVRIVTGIPDMVLSSPTAGWSVSVPSLELVMTILVVLVLGYTLLGGMVSVVVTDYIQFVVLTLGMGVTTWLVLTNSETGGIAGIARVVQEFRPGAGMNPLTTATRSVSAGEIAIGLGGIYVAWQILHWTASSCWQTSAFRTAAADSPRTVKLMWSLSAINYFGRAIIPMLWGVAALTYFVNQGIDLDSWDAAQGTPATLASYRGPQDTDPPATRAAGATIAPGETPAILRNWDSGKTSDRALQAMPRYMARILPSGVIGLLVAGMLAALMSTHSAYLLSWSGVLAEDLLAPVLRSVGIELSDRTRLWITRFFILCLGVYLVTFGLWYKTKTDIWTFLAVTGTMYFAGAATVLGFGLYWKHANVGGAFGALIAGATPGAITLILHILTLVLGSSASVGKLSGHLSEPVVGLISYPLGILGMIVGSLAYERFRGAPPDEFVGVSAPAGGPPPTFSGAVQSEDTQ